MTHGGNINRIAERFGLREDGVIDFSASINPLGLPRAAVAEIQKSLGAVVNYPDPDTGLFRRAAASHSGVEPERVLAGNGSTELIYLIPRALNPKTVLIPQPTFSEYERACVLAGAGVRHLMLGRAEGYRVEPDEFIPAMRGMDMAFLCNPNNPTGDVLGRDAMREVVRAAGKLQCVLVVDEAFMDFCPDESVIDMENPYLIVLRSMTKFYALSGLRLGFGVFPKRLMKKLKAHKEPWSVNMLAQRAGIAALGNGKYRKKTHRLIKEEKEFMEEGFRERGIKHYPSRVNYYLLEIRGAREAVEGLLKEGIAVRDCSNFRGLGRDHIRVAVKGRGDNERLLRELGRYVP